MVKEVVKLTPIIFKLPKIKKIRVAADARVSTEKDEQHNNLEAQKAYFTKYIKERNDWKFAGLYYDDGTALHAVRCLLFVTASVQTEFSTFFSEF